mgnify:CR=1 FL=1
MSNFISEIVIGSIGATTIIIALLCYVASYDYRGTKLTDRQADILFYIAISFFTIGCLFFYWIFKN